MCSIQSDGNGGHHLRFGPKEWIGIAGLIFGGMTAAVTLMWFMVGMRIHLELAEHSVTPHPVTDQRLHELEKDGAP